MSDHKDENRARDEARKYAWDWFAYHAKQRLDVFRFYLIVVALIFAGALRLLETGLYFLSITLSMFLIFCTFLFYRLDRRNSTLVKLGEKYLKEEEKLLSEEINSKHIMILKQAENKKGCFSSFSQIFRYMFIAVVVIATCTSAFSVYKWLRVDSDVSNSAETSVSTPGTTP